MHGIGRLWMGALGAFFLAWGAWELGEMMGWLPNARFPWPLFIVIMGAAFLYGAARGHGWGAMWTGWDDGDCRDRGERGDRGERMDLGTRGDRGPGGSPGTGPGR